MAARTYYVGQLGQVRRLTNFSLPWVSVDITSSFPSYNGTLYDVMTDPNNPNKVFAVGEVQNGYGIFVSVNGGNSWVGPGGDHTSAKVYYEVWVIDSNTIVAVGDLGRVVKSTDGGLTFNHVSYPLGIPNGTAYSVHFVSPLEGIVGIDNGGTYVYRTVDGGLTWSALNGGVDLNTIVSTLRPVAVYMSTDLQTIIVCGQSAILRSTDGGNTFTMVYDFLYREGLHMTWMPKANATVFWATTQGDGRIQSTDGGATWTVQNPTLMPGLQTPRIFAAHYHTFNNGFYSGEGNMRITADSGLTGVITDTIPADVIITAVWTTSVPCYQLTDCQNQLPAIVTNTDLSQYIGQVVQIPGSNTCWTVSIALDCPDSAIPVVISQVFADCVSCLGTCYNLTNCANQGEVLVTDTDLSQYLDQVIHIEGSTECWFVSESLSCDGASPVVVTESFATCDECLPHCYILSNCQNNQETISVADDLSAYVGMVIQIPDDDRCWVVTESTDPVLCDCPIMLSGPVVRAFANCSQCPPPYVPEPTKPFVQPGFETRVCNTQDYIDAKCNFGEAMYKDVVRKRYGVKICCEDDMDAAWIKNQQADLAEMFDPTVCIPVVPATDCCPPCNVTSSLLVFNSTSCPAPSNVISDLILPEPVCPEPTNVISSLDVPPVCECYEVYVPHPVQASISYTDCNQVVQTPVLAGLRYVCALGVPVFTSPVPPNAYIVPTDFAQCDGICVV